MGLRRGFLRKSTPAWRRLYVSTRFAASAIFSRFQVVSNARVVWTMVFYRASLLVLPCARPRLAGGASPCMLLHVLLVAVEFWGRVPRYSNAL
jgi:hypothetical protein